MILFQLLFEVTEEKRGEFERTYVEVFEPALRKQKGFQNAKLIRLFTPTQVAEIEAAPTELNYQVNFVFDSEANRRVWSKTPDHDVAWPKLSGLARTAIWRGYELLVSSPGA